MDTSGRLSPHKFYWNIIKALIDRLVSRRKLTIPPKILNEIKLRINERLKDSNKVKAFSDEFKKKFTAPHIDSHGNRLCMAFEDDKLCPNKGIFSIPGCTRCTFCKKHIYYYKILFSVKLFKYLWGIALQDMGSDYYNLWCIQNPEECW